MRIKTIRNCKNIFKKAVLLRLDFNIPIRNKRILDDFKIIKTLPTIRFLLRYKCKIIIISHLGRPFKKRGENYSLKPLALYLNKLLDRKVEFIDSCIGEKTKKKVSKMKEGDILLLENLRFYKGEENNDLGFAEELAALADIYVNDAFSVSHRKHASVSVIKKILPSYAGLLLEKELNHLKKIIHPQKPFVLVVGGAKIKTKLPLIKRFEKRASSILIGGAVANNFFAAQGIEIGKSFISKEDIEISRKIKGSKIILPIDVMVSNRRNGRGKIKHKKISEINKSEIILDIGPETIKLYSGLIKEAKSVFWNGPMGMFENPHFKHGSLSLAMAIACRSRGKVYGAAGGGETIEALKMAKMLGYMDWVSTGGGACLAYLGGEEMPGLDLIIK